MSTNPFDATRTDRQVLEEIRRLLTPPVLSAPPPVRPEPEPRSAVSLRCTTFETTAEPRIEMVEISVYVSKVHVGTLFVAASLFPTMRSALGSGVEFIIMP